MTSTDVKSGDRFKQDVGDLGDFVGGEIEMGDVAGRMVVAV